MGALRRFFKAAVVLFLMTFGPAAKAQETVILALGDSLTAGYGLSLEDALPAQLEKLLKDKGQAVRIINAGVSGDTTSGGLARLEWSLEQKPDAVILALGANDMLRAVDPKLTEENLKKMLQTLKQKNIPVLLAGMKNVRNLAPFFGDGFQKIYKNLAKEYDAVYYPFLLEGVSSQPELNLADGIHPNTRGIAVMANGLLPYAEELLEKVKKRDELINNRNDVLQ